MAGSELWGFMFIISTDTSTAMVKKCFVYPTAADTEALRSSVTCPKSPTWTVAEATQKPGSLLPYPALGMLAGSWREGSQLPHTRCLPSPELPAPGHSQSHRPAVPWPEV